METQNDETDPSGSFSRMSVTVLLLLGAESSGLNSLGIAYLLLYNLIFILPMIVITVMVGGGRTSAETL